MKKWFTEEQIINVLKEGEAGIPAREICRKYGISDATFYTWSKKYAGMDAQDVKSLKQLEEENVKLKRMLDNDALKTAINRKCQNHRISVRPFRRCWSKHEDWLSQRRAYLLVELSRSTLSYTSGQSKMDKRLVTGWMYWPMSAAGLVIVDCMRYWGGKILK